MAIEERSFKGIPCRWAGGSTFGWTLTRCSARGKLYEDHQIRYNNDKKNSHLS